jgi:hypothetical protein
MADTTTLKGNNNLVIDFAQTPVVALTCTDNFGNVWSEMNVTLMASEFTERGFIRLPQISTLYPLTTQINFTIQNSLKLCSFEPYRSDYLGEDVNTINGNLNPITLIADNSTIPFSSGLNNNWIVPQLLVSQQADQPVKA